jgi:predicted chitinase
MPWVFDSFTTKAGSYVDDTLISNLGQQPTNATYILAVAASPNVDPGHYFASVLAPGVVSLDSASVNASTVNFTYHDTGPSASFTISLYESANATFNPAEDTSTDTLIANQEITIAANSSGNGRFATPFVPNPAQPYLLVVVDPILFVQQSAPSGPIHELPAYLVSAAQLEDIMPDLTASDTQRYIAPLNEAMEEFQINLPKREAAFLAQVAYESGELHKWKETFPSAKNLKKGYHLPGNHRPALPKTLANAAAWFEYWYGVNRKYPQPAKGLGNTEPGDGANYYGRGPLQITGRSIYADAGSALGLNLLANPNLVSDSINTPGVGFRTSAYWWTIFKGSIRLPRRGGKTLTQWADSVNPQSASSVKLVNTMISRIVTGASGDNGSFGERQDFYEDALNTLHA